MSRIVIRLTLMGVLMVLAVGCRHAASSPNPVAAPSDDALRVPRATIAPRLTADPDDPAWTNAASVAGMTLAKYSSKTDRPLPTEVRLLWDAEWLYVRFLSTGPEPYAPFGKERDALHYKGDVVEIFLDPVGDGRQYFEIQQSPESGIFDLNTTVTAEPRFDKDGRLVDDILARDWWPNTSYDMPDLRQASRAVQRESDWVWIADFALPADAVLKRLGKKKYAPMSLRMNLIRYHPTAKIGVPGYRLIAMNWSAVKFGCPHQSPGAMRGVQLIER